MARTKSKKSKLSFGALNLSADEEKLLKDKLQEQKRSLAYVKRALILKYIQGEISLL